MADLDPCQLGDTVEVSGKLLRVYQRHIGTQLGICHACVYQIDTGVEVVEVIHEGSARKYAGGFVECAEGDSTHLDDTILMTASVVSIQRSIMLDAGKSAPYLVAFSGSHLRDYEMQRQTIDAYLFTLDMALKYDNKKLALRALEYLGAQKLTRDERNKFDRHIFGHDVPIATRS